jgi:hypothetical protein
MLTVKGYILNENNIPVTDAAVFVNQKLVLKSSGQTGFFTIAVQKNDTITLRKGKTRDQLSPTTPFRETRQLSFFNLLIHRLFWKKLP